MNQPAKTATADEPASASIRDQGDLSQQNAALEQRVNELMTQLQGTHQELEGFVYSVSHDLRAPLRHVLGFVKILEAEAGPLLAEKNLGYLATIAAAARQMEDLIDGLVSFSRISRAEMHMKEVDLDEMVRATICTFQEETRQRQIDWNLHPLPAVLADRVMLRMVLANLISNALKFTARRANARIEIGCTRSTTETVIFIRDNGAGFDPRYAAKLFGVFQRLHTQDEFPGLGIGLAKVQRIIHRHGGRTWARSVVDGGASFYFSIPGAVGKQ